MTAPFGIELGSHVSQLEVIQELTHGKRLVKPPKEHPLFESYAVQASPSFGIVWVKGLSAQLPNDSYGHAAKALADKVAGQLAVRYGEGKKTDQLFPGAVSDSAGDWATALLYGERLYFYLWERPASRMLPEDLETIFLGVTAVDGYTTTVDLEYSSTKIKAAEAELDRSLSDIL